MQEHAERRDTARRDLSDAEAQIAQGTTPSKKKKGSPFKKLFGSNKKKDAKKEAARVAMANAAAVEARQLAEEHDGRVGARGQQRGAAHAGAAGGDGGS